jgi:hypothetical protein
MSLRHIVITRFSYRGRDVFKRVAGPPFHRAEDPLEPKRLDIRFMLFELTCLPSVLAQVEQGFDWVLLVDRALPASYLARLRSLVSVRKATFIHAFDPQSDPGALGWLRDYLPADTHRVVTSNLDDDDSLPTRFTGVLQERFRKLAAKDRLPPIAIVGARQIVQWDLFATGDAPLGWKAPWHRATRVASAGLSLCCTVPAFDFCVLGLRHALADDYLDFARAPAHPNVSWMRRALSASAARAGVDLSSWPREAYFHDISPDVGPVLMTNHVSNDQSERLFESKPERTAVTGPADFPDLPVDWSKAPAVVRALGSGGQDSTRP